jgi:VWFA-related protein
MRHFAWSLALCAAASAALVAQSAQQPGVFKSGVDLVRFDVSVVDSDGKPLPDVRPDEVEILEGGKPRPLVMFQRVQEPAGFYTEAALRAASAEVTTNEASPRGHLYVLVFDQEHIAPGNEESARQAAATFLRTSVRPSDRVAMFAIPGPGPNLTFTADTTRAIKELGTIRGTLDRIVTSGIGKYSIEEAYRIVNGDTFVADNVVTRLGSDLSADVTTNVAVSSDRGSARFAEGDYTSQLAVLKEDAERTVHQVDASTRDTLQRLSEVMRRLKSVEGRKTVLFFSEGFHDQNVARELQNVAAAAAESYAVLYTFDLNRRLANLAGGTPAATTAASEAASRTTPLANLALETNGVFFNDASNRVEQALTTIAAQSQDYYIAGFLPSEKALADRGSYQPVTVRVKRPGARVSARTGYSVPSNSAAPDRRNAIDAALAAPFAQQALTVNYTTYVLRSDATGHPRVVLSLDADLPLKDEKRDRADVVFVVRDARSGRVAASGSDTIDLPDATTPGSYFGHGGYRVQFEVAPGSYLMRAVVREPGGLIGSADRRLEVRDVAGPSIAASDLVLASGGGGLPVRATAYMADGLRAGLEIYGRSAEQLAGVKVALSLTAEDGAIARTVETALGDVETVTGGALRHMTGALPLDSLAPGVYVARARVTDGGDEVTTVTRQVEIVAGSAPPAAVTAAAVNAKNVTAGPIFSRARTEWITADPTLAAHARRGLDLFAQGNFTAAAPELQTAFNGNQRSAATAFVLGWAWEGTGDSRRAIGAWRGAAAADPTLMSAHLAIADAYVRLGNPALAIQALRAGLAVLPDAVELRTALERISASR